MKNKMIVINLLLFVLYGTLTMGQGSSIKVRPEKPKPGEKITIAYDPSGTVLEKAGKISMIFHAYGKAIKGESMYYTDEVILKRKSNVWTGEFSAADSCAGVILRFTDGENYDNNESKCFPIRFYGKDGKFVKYASGGLGNCYNILDVILRIKPGPDAETLVRLYRDEFNIYPEAVRDFLLQYVYVYKKVDREKGLAYLNDEAEKYEKTSTQKLNDLIFLSDLYIAQQMYEKADSMCDIIVKKYPMCEDAERIKFGRARSMKDPARKTELINKFKTQFPNSIYIKYLLHDPTEDINNGKYEEAYNLVETDPKPSSADYNNIAWSMYEKNFDLPFAKKIALKGLELLDAEKRAKLAKKSPYYSQDQNKKRLKSYGYEITDTYGAILLKLGENAEALKYMTKAHEMTGGDNTEINERYEQALLVNGKTK